MDPKALADLQFSPLSSCSHWFAVFDAVVRCWAAAALCGQQMSRMTLSEQQHCSLLRMNHANHLMDIYNTVTDRHLVSVVHLHTLVLQRCVQVVFYFVHIAFKMLLVKSFYFEVFSVRTWDSVGGSSSDSMEARLSQGGKRLKAKFAKMMFLW